MLGVSDRSVRAVLSGAKPGANLLAAARQLAAEGRVTTPPERRAQRVREKGGGVSAKPVRTGDTGESARYTFEGGKRAQTAVRAPSRGLGRERARDAILRDLRAHRGGEKTRGAQRVSFKLRLKNGNTISLGSKGGYDPALVARQMSADADDPFYWLFHQAASIGSYSDEISGASDIEAVVLTYF